MWKPCRRRRCTLMVSWRLVAWSVRWHSGGGVEQEAAACEQFAEDAEVAGTDPWTSAVVEGDVDLEVTGAAAPDRGGRRETVVGQQPPVQPGCGADRIAGDGDAARGFDALDVLVAGVGGQHWQHQVLAGTVGAGHDVQLQAPVVRQHGALNTGFVRRVRHGPAVPDAPACQVVGYGGRAVRVLPAGRRSASASVNSVMCKGGSSTVGAAGVVVVTTRRSCRGRRCAGRYSRSVWPCPVWWGRWRRRSR